MDRTENEGSRDGEPASNETKPHPALHRPTETLWGKIASWTIKLLSSGLLVVLITNVFQYQERVYQDRVSQNDQDAKTLLNIDDKLNNVIVPRFFRTKRFVQALVLNVTEKELNSAERDFNEIEREWFDQEAGLRANLEFYVDTPSNKNTGDKRQEIFHNNQNCTEPFAFAEGMGVDATVASDVLQVVSNCHSLVASSIKTLLDSRTLQPKLSPAQKKEVIESESKLDDHRLDQVWWINDVLRCIVMQRAIEVRYRGSTDNLWDYISRLGTTNSESAPTKRDCVSDYRAWSKTASSQSGS